MGGFGVPGDGEVSVTVYVLLPESQIWLCSSGILTSLRRLCRWGRFLHLLERCEAQRVKCAERSSNLTEWGREHDDMFYIWGVKSLDIHFES